MVARIWRTGVKPERFEEYERFARECSLPMFCEQRGFIARVRELCKRMTQRIDEMTQLGEHLLLLVPALHEGVMPIGGDECAERAAHGIDCVRHRATQDHRRRHCSSGSADERIV